MSHQSAEVIVNSISRSLKPAYIARLPIQGRLFLVVGRKLVNDNEHNWLHTSNYVFG